MCIFLEVEDERTPEEEERGIPPCMMRIKVSSIDEARRILIPLLGYFRKPKAYVHYCFHDEDPTRPCRRVRIY